MSFKTKNGAAILGMLGAALGIFLLANKQTSSAGPEPLLKRAEIRAVAEPATPSECQPVLDALDKLLTTAYHMYMTQTGILPGKIMTSETVFVGGARYILYDGKWSPSQVSTQDMKEMEERNRKNAKNISCQHVRDEAVNGEGAALYSTHEETEHGKTDSQLWISKSKGLVLRQETDLDTGAANKSHLSVRYEYSNVQAPKL
jgi:hypothetical protein